MRFGLIQRADGETDVYNHVVANTGFRRVGEINFFDDSAKAARPVRRSGSLPAMLSILPGIARHMANLLC